MDTRFVRADAVEASAARELTTSHCGGPLSRRGPQGQRRLPDDEAAVVDRLLASEACGSRVLWQPVLDRELPFRENLDGRLQHGGDVAHVPWHARCSARSRCRRLPVSVPGSAALWGGLDVALNPMKLLPAGAADATKFKPVYHMLDRARSRTKPSPAACWRWAIAESYSSMLWPADV